MSAHTSLENEIIEAAARAAYASAWADYEEERGRSVSGEIMDVAPRTPSKARTWAKELFDVMSEMNGGLSIAKMYHHAETMQHTKSWHKDPTPEDFGHYTAMQALGHGVSWSDDHPKHGLLVPHAEFSKAGPRDFWTSVSKRAGIGSRG